MFNYNHYVPILKAKDGEFGALSELPEEIKSRISPVIDIFNSKSKKSLENNQISWSMTNSTKLVAPIRGKEKMLGTNPIAIAFPGHKEPPIVIDLATSAAAYGKIEIANRKNTTIPKGWSINKDGENTTNPKEMIEGGSLLPIGSFEEIGGHK